MNTVVPGKTTDGLGWNVAKCGTSQRIGWLISMCNFAGILHTGS